MLVDGCGLTAGSAGAEALELDILLPLEKLSSPHLHMVMGMVTGHDMVFVFLVICRFTCLT